jgi:hypothetical protein
LPVSPKSVAVIDSQLWLRPNACEVNARIEIERPQPDLLVQHILPNWGGSSNPMRVHFFMVCVARHYGTQYGYSYMRMVAPKGENLATHPDGSFDFTILLEKKDSGKQGEKTNAAGEMIGESIDFADARENCSKMLADEFK